MIEHASFLARRSFIIFWPPGLATTACGKPQVSFLRIPYFSCIILSTVSLARGSIVNEKIRIVIADDHAMFRQGISSLLKFDPGLVIAGEAANGSELLKTLNGRHADIILLDIQMPVMNGTQTLEVLKQRFPDLGVIIVSMEFNPTIVQKYFERGAHGFIPKGCDVEVLVDAIYQVKEKGNCYDLSFELAGRLNKYSLKHFENTYVLSTREIEVLRLACKGNSNKEIGHTLRITERTVEFHKTNIYLKTGLKSLSDLIAYGIRNGLDNYN